MPCQAAQSWHVGWRMWVVASSDWGLSPAAWREARKVAQGVMGVSQVARWCRAMAGRWRWHEWHVKAGRRRWEGGVLASWRWRRVRRRCWEVERRWGGKERYAAKGSWRCGGSQGGQPARWADMAAAATARSYEGWSWCGRCGGSGGKDAGWVESRYLSSRRRRCGSVAGPGRGVELPQRSQPPAMGGHSVVTGAGATVGVAAMVCAVARAGATARAGAMVGAVVMAGVVVMVGVMVVGGAAAEAVEGKVVVAAEGAAVRASAETSCGGGGCEGAQTGRGGAGARRRRCQSRMWLGRRSR